MGDAFGSGISSAGDQDGDGLPDIAIGAACATIAADEDGAVYIFQSTSSGVFDASQARSVLGGESEYDEAGSSVALAGDVNGDGQPDLCVGAPGWDPEDRSRGAVYVFFGPVSEGYQSLTDASVRLEGTYDGAHPDLGNEVTGVGDTNGDGLDDVLVRGWLEDLSESYYHSHLLLGRE